MSKIIELIIILLPFICGEKIIVNNGELIITHLNKCVITYNNHIYKYDIKNVMNDSVYDIDLNGNVILPGLWFGLIRYECDGVEATIISKPECEKCTMICIKNQYIPGCEYKKLSIILGIIVGCLTLLILILLIILLIKYTHIGHVLWNVIMEYTIIKCYYLRDSRRITKYIEISKQLNIKRKLEFCIIGDEIGPNTAAKISENRVKLTTRYDNYMLTHDIPKIRNYPNLTIGGSDIQSSKFTQKRFQIQKPTIIRPEAIYDNVTQSVNLNTSGSKGYNSLSEIDSQTKLLTESEKFKKNEIKGSFKSRHPGLIITIIAILLFPLAMCCDSTLFLSTQGKICDKNNCHDSMNYLITLTEGQHVCFRTINNDLISFNIKQSLIRVRYQQIYLTSDIDVDVSSYWICKGKNECWYGSCMHDQKGENYKIINSTSSNNYGCLVDSLGCDTYCFHRISCVYYSYEIKQKGEVAKVYKIVSKIWELNIEVCYKNKCIIKTFNTNNPRVDVIESIKDFDDDTKNILNNKMPITIISTDYEKVHIEENLICDNNIGCVMHKASEINFPVAGTVGDVQLQINNLKMINYPITDIHCKLKKCKPDCIYREPGINVLRRNKINNRLKDNIESIVNIDENTNELKIKTMSTISFVIGNVNFQNLHIEPAHCQLSAVMTYGCTGCNIKPYIVIQAYNIKNQGILPIETNCSSSAPFLSCSDEPYIVTLNKISEHCFFYMPTTNQTLYVTTDVKFNGNIDMTRTIRSKENFIDALQNLSSGPEFFNSLQWTFGSCLILTGLIAFINRVIKGIIVYKTASKNISDEMK